MSKKEIMRDSFSLLEAEYGIQNESKKEVWAKILGCYPAQKIMNACIECIRTKKFFPRVSEMIELIEGNIESEAELAWLLLLDRIEKKGHYQSVSFPEYPAIGAVVLSMGGWIKMCEMKMSEEKWVKKDFLILYKIMKKKGIYPDKLTGQFELDNSSRYSEEYLLERYGMYLDGSKDATKKIETPKEESSDEMKMLEKE